jgi:uncharacterized protein YoxC
MIAICLIIFVISVLFVCSELYDIADEINKMTRVLKSLKEDEKEK